jgi:signal transduction histidine kinase/PAS domain-containing protein/ActR/RegA family two-component response regulator/HPt (histidine-containing phosphotransfer) domain-containing protein
MPSAVHDPDRLAILRATRLLDSAPDDAFDRFTRLATTILGAPTALLSLVDERRQFFKSASGLSEPWATRRETPLTHSLCRHVVDGKEALVLDDARTDARFRDHAAVTDLKVAAYAGVPLTTGSGHVLGAFCAIDSAPRAWGDKDLTVLRELADAAMVEIELRAANAAMVERLERTLAHKDALFANLPLGVVLFDRELRFRRVNERMSAIDGIPIDAHLGRPLCEVLPRVPKEIEESCLRVLESEVAELDRVVETGERTWRVGLFPVRIGDETIGVGCTLADISEETRLAAERERQQALLQAILDNAPTALSVRARDGRVLFANQAFAREMKKDVKDVIGKTVGDLMLAAGFEANSPGTATETDDIVRRFGRRTFDVSYCKDGARTHWRNFKFILGREHGFEDAVAALALDVTEQIEGRTHLEVIATIGKALASDLDVDRAFDLAAQALIPECADGCAVFLRDENGKVTMHARHADPALAELVVAMTERFPPHPNTGSGEVIRTGKVQLFTELPADFAAERAVNEEHRAMLERFDLSSYVLAPITVRGRVEGTFALYAHRPSGKRFYARDVSLAQEIAMRIGLAYERQRLFDDRERAVAELRRANELLEARVEERTRELARQNLALAEAREEAERANEAKGRFLAQMSHEIRTPLNGVLGMATLLRDTDLTPEQAETVDTLRSSGESLLTILNEILDFSKVEAGHVELEVQPFALASSVRDTLDLFRPTAKAKGVALGYSIGPEVPDGVRGDPTRLRQVLSNLVGNALKFTAHGSVDVAITSGGPAPAAPDQPETARVFVEIRVKDTGVGISPAQQARLFQPFVQADQSTTRLYGGTGLGLTIAKHLVERMGGTIALESEPGVGTTFLVRVPFASAPLVKLHDFAQPLFDPTMASRFPLRVLVADDNVINQKVAARMLARLGYDVDVVSDGIEVVEAATARPYDVIFMDVQMPRMNGLDATRRLRELSPDPRSPQIVAMTAGAFDEDRAACTLAGINDFVSKPVRAPELATALMRAAHVLGPHARKLSLRPFAATTGAPIASGASGPAAAAPRGSLRPAASGVDKDVIAELEGVFGDTREVDGIVSRFLNNAQKGAISLDQAIKSGDSRAIMATAHTLTSTAGMVGAMALSRLYRDLMEASGNPGRAREIERAIRVELDVVVAEFAKRPGAGS